jgi:hypothetical protein
VWYGSAGVALPRTIAFSSYPVLDQPYVTSNVQESTARANCPDTAPRLNQSRQYKMCLLLIDLQMMSHSNTLNI